MPENKLNCPICNESKNEVYLNCKDHTVSGLSFTIVKCSSCGFKYTCPVPPESEIGKYYKAESYISHTDTKKGFINKLYHFVRNITLKKKLQLLDELSEKGKILDVGCGTGHFLKECKNNGWKVEGTEPDPDARKIAENLTGSEISETVFTKGDFKSYNIISLWHVLEHVHRLNESLEQIKKLLNDRGHLIIAVPNCESFDAKHYKEHWAAYDLPRHLYHFTQDTMEKLLHKHGFKIIKKTPMVFDSFYVSMMSEKYKNGNLLGALLTGLRSNLKGRSRINYSSITYIAEKINKS
jgi:2-polyprenyl-3-methyl-5-hydroxy-6-metoxy-1,4-benzoquinol methylase